MPPPRRAAKTTPQKHELEAFAEKYDTLTLLYGDPVEMVFRIMSGSGDEEVQLRAAEMLMSYRYPRVKSVEGTGKTAPILNFNVTMPKPELATAPTAARVLEITGVPHE
jgi:hypothetical protein